MAGVKSKALVLLHEEQFKKGKFYLHVELVPARQADIVRKKREKEGYKQLSVIFGTSPEFQLCPGEKVNISIEGALKPAKPLKSDQMIIEFAEGNNCCRQLSLAVNESDKSSSAEVTFTRTKKNQFLLEATIDISDYAAKDKPTLPLNDLGAKGISSPTEHTKNISEEPDSLINNNAQPNSLEDSKVPMILNIKKLYRQIVIEPTRDNSNFECQNTAPGSPKDDPSKQGKPVDKKTYRHDLSAYNKIMTDHGLGVLAQALDPHNSWRLLISLGLLDSAIKKHETNHLRDITQARANALMEWRNNNKDKDKEELYLVLIEKLNSIGRRDIVQHLKTICEEGRDPEIAYFQ